MVAPDPIDPRVFRASALGRGRAPVDAWPQPVDAWPQPGSIVALSGGGGASCTSLAVAAVVAIQCANGVVAWIQPKHGWLFPPDLAQNGVDLAALVVVHVPVQRSTAKSTNHALPAAAELLLRSGAFDLLVLDLRPAGPPRGAWVARLQALAREHQSRVMVLTDARATADGVGIAQKIEPRRRRDGALFVVEPQLVRDKLPTADRPRPLRRRGPAGLS
ncbi:MAG: hypothetical protein JNK78_00040 [Planctomycetes bacterium]|nr:hypothetical protein [Planctomycetota bacterium]